MEFKQSLGRVSVPRRPAASLVGHSSQADLRMVAAALPHALPSRPSKDVPGRLSLQGPLGPSRLSPQPIPNAREPIFFMGDAEVPGGERAGRMKGQPRRGFALISAGAIVQAACGCQTAVLACLAGQTISNCGLALPQRASAGPLDPDHCSWGTSPLFGAVARTHGDARWTKAVLRARCRRPWGWRGRVTHRPRD